jgi:hypothetical protein
VIIKKHKKIDSRDSAKDSGYIHLVSIPWQGQKSYWWNEACASVVEVFGLPGERFTSHPKMDQMDFLFKSQKDADLCRILLSERL